jgi:Ca2+-binding RTX toxin-like protein
MRILLAVVVFSFCAADAQAATVSIERHVLPPDPFGGNLSGARLNVLAAPGETNALAVSTRGTIVVRDAGAPLTAGAGCRSQADGSVVCSSDLPFVGTTVDAGDGDDRIAFDGDFGTLHGGAGNDVVDSANASPAGFGSELWGDDGDDVLHGDGVLKGGPGGDRLSGGPAEDTLLGGPGSDVIDGGAGEDTVSFADDTAGVVVDLADPGPDGGDEVTGVEDVVGGSGDDRIAGDDGANWIYGGPGRDAIAGRSGDDHILGDDFGGDGDDELDGGDGDDSLDGGDGDDSLDGGDGDDSLDGGHGSDRFRAGAGNDDILPSSGHRGDAAAIACDEGEDLVKLPDPRTLLRGDCERVLVRAVTVDRLVLGRALRFRVRHTDRSSTAECRINVTVGHRGRPLGAGSVLLHRNRRAHRGTIPLRRPSHDVEIVFRGSYNCDRSGGLLEGGFRLRR